MMDGKNKKLKIAVILLLLFLFQQISSKFGAFVADIFDYSAIDKYNVFAWISVHHIAQAILALVAIILLSKLYHLDFGFHLGDKKTGIKYVKLFTMAMLGYMLVTSVITYLSNQIIRYDYPLTLTNILGSLGFQLFLSGPSEEILFRALPITVISCFVPFEKDIKILKLHISWATFISAIFFALAHIKWTINPFSFSFDYMQLLFCFVLGIMDGIVYQKSKSVIYPMIMHSINNVAVVGAGYILSILK